MRKYTNTFGPMIYSYPKVNLIGTATLYRGHVILLIEIYFKEDLAKYEK